LEKYRPIVILSQCAQQSEPLAHRRGITVGKQDWTQEPLPPHRVPVAQIMRLAHVYKPPAQAHLAKVFYTMAL